MGTPMGEPVLRGVGDLGNVVRFCSNVQLVEPGICLPVVPPSDVVFQLSEGIAGRESRLDPVWRQARGGVCFGGAGVYCGVED